MNNTPKITEGGLEAPTRYPIPWREESFYDVEKIEHEMERVFDICHGCRRCVNLCEAFPVLFDLIDESENFDVQSVNPKDYAKVSEQCYLCNMCYQNKCPYVPPHKWQIDFPNLMLRDKAAQFRRRGASIRDRIITSTDSMGRIMSAPLLHRIVNRLSRVSIFRTLLQYVFRIHRKARLPDYQPPNIKIVGRNKRPATPTKNQRGVALFATCHGKWNNIGIPQDLAIVLRHNNIIVKMLEAEWCCGMPKFELGDLKAVERNKQRNIPVMLRAIKEGYDIIATVPSCVLMFKEEIPRMFPEEDAVQEVSKHVYDPFEYLYNLHRAKKLNTQFAKGLGRVAYQSACHQRVQNIGRKTAEILSLLPDTDIHTIERCTGHDGTYAVRAETYEHSMKIVAPVAKAVRESKAESYTSDCPLSANHIAHALGDKQDPMHPISLLRKAYAI